MTCFSTRLRQRSVSGIEREDKAKIVTHLKPEKKSTVALTFNIQRDGARDPRKNPRDENPNGWIIDGWHVSRTWEAGGIQQTTPGIFTASVVSNRRKGDTKENMND